MPTRRGNHFSARSTACSDATSVAPRRFALRRRAAPTAASASAGSSADTGSSASISVGPLVQHAGDADALQLAAGEPVAAVEQRGRPRSSRASASRAPAMSPGTSSEASAFHAGQAPSRPASTAVTTRSRGGIGGAWCTTPMRARRRRSAPAPSCHGSSPSDLRRALRSAAATRRGRAAASSCRRPTGRSRPPARRARERSVTPRSARWPLRDGRGPTPSSATASASSRALLDQPGRPAPPPRCRRSSTPWSG